MKEKNLSGLIAFVSTLIILCLIAGFIGMYSVEIYKWLKPENNVETEKVDEITQEEALNVINANYGISWILDEEKQSITNMPDFISQYSNQRKLFILIINIQKDENILTENDHETISKDTLETKALNIFGSKDAVKHEDVYSYGEKYYIYDEVKEEYTLDPEYEATGFPKINVYNHFVNFKRENNVFVLTVTKAFSDDLLEGNHAKVYSNYSDFIIENNNYLFNAEEVLEDYDNLNVAIGKYFDDNYSSFKDKLVTYKYVMTKKEGIIKVTSYEIEK